MNVFYGQDTEEYVQPNANDLPLETRLVHHVVSTNFIPKIRRFEHITNRELFFLWAYLTDSRIDFPMFILDQMYRTTMNNVSLPYRMFLTKVF